MATKYCWIKCGCLFNFGLRFVWFQIYWKGLQCTSNTLVWICYLVSVCVFLFLYAKIYIYIYLQPKEITFFFNTDIVLRINRQLKTPKALFLHSNQLNALVCICNHAHLQYQSKHGKHAEKRVRGKKATWQVGVESVCACKLWRCSKCFWQKQAKTSPIISRLNKNYSMAVVCLHSFTLCLYTYLSWQTDNFVTLCNVFYLMLSINKTHKLMEEYNTLQ